MANKRDLESLTGEENEPKRIHLSEVNLLRQEVGELKEEIAIVSRKIGEMCLSHGSTLSSLQFHSDYLETLSNKVANLNLDETNRDRRMDKIEQNARQQGNKMMQIDRDVQGLSRDMKTKNIVVNGLSEKKGENPMKIAVKFLKNISKTVSASDIESAYRLGNPGEMKRPLLVKFKSIETRNMIMQNKASLKKTKNLKKIFCNEDLPDPARKTRQIMREIGRYATKLGYENVRVTGNKIQIGDRTYHERDLALLPPELHIGNIKTRVIKGMLCFEGESSYLANSFPVHIKVNDNHFSSADQAFYYQMATFAGRTDYGNDIMKYDDPKILKKMGSKIEKSTEWEDKQLRILTGILILKFEQNPMLKEKLVKTGDMPLINCDTDNYWGAGRLLDSDQWDTSNEIPGRNMIGTILSNVRSRIRPAGEPNPSPNASPIAAAAKKIEKCVKSTVPTLKELATRIISNPPLGENPRNVQELDHDLSTGSIDLGGAMLKMLHNTLGMRQTKSLQLDISTTSKAKDYPKPRCDTNIGSIADTDPADTNINRSVGVENEHDEVKDTNDASNYEKSGSDKSSDISGSILDLTENSSASIDSLSIRSLQVEDIKNITTSEGRVDTEKLANLPFPSINVSKSLERSFAAMKAESTTSKKSRNIKKLDNQPPHSTPVSTITSRRPTRRSKRHADEKEKMDALLKDLNI